VKKIIAGVSEGAKATQSLDVAALILTMLASKATIHACKNRWLYEDV
jgi:hypothetical protein